MTQTAVEYLNEQIRLNSKFKENSKGGISFTIGLSKIDKLFKQAKEMEKQQIIDANTVGINQGLYGYKNAEQYYNETYKK